MNDIYTNIEMIQNDKISIIVESLQIKEKPYMFEQQFKEQIKKLKEVKEDFKKKMGETDNGYEKKILLESVNQNNIIINSLQNHTSKKSNVKLGLNLEKKLVKYKVDIIRFINSDELEFGPEDIKGINTSLRNQNKNFIHDEKQYNIKKIKNGDAEIKKVLPNYINLHTNFLRQFNITDAENYNFQLIENTISYKKKLNANSKEFVPEEK